MKKGMGLDWIIIIFGVVLLTAIFIYILTRGNISFIKEAGKYISSLFKAITSGVS